MSLKTMEPDPGWDPAAHPDVVETFAALGDDVTITVWGRDSCGDCKRELPGLAAALAAAGFPRERVRVIPVNHFKEGPLVEDYGVDRIATVVIERDGEELARFVEEEDRPAPEHLATRLREREVVAEG